jgi:glutamyl-tRNA synthetase
VTVRGRFAPSPTGALHLGNARTALLAWLHARAAGGRFVMRVEDLDPGRVRSGLMEGQLADLRWLGLDWDEGPDVGGPHAPYVQTQRAARYDAALDALARAGLLFACTCSRRDIAAAASAPHAGDEGPRYPGTCRGRTLSRWPEPSLPDAPVALRLRTEPEEVCFHDALHGRVCLDPAAEGGDFVVRRRDGVAAYQLAVVVDDAAMEVTHVVRGADLLASTPRQLLLYRALGLTPPAWMHVPLLLGPDGERLAKRHGAVSLADARAAGAAPEAVAGWLASTCGLAGEGERVAARDLVARFRVEALPRGPAAVSAAALASLAAR